MSMAIWLLVTLVVSTVAAVGFVLAVQLRWIPATRSRPGKPPVKPSLLPDAVIAAEVRPLYGNDELAAMGLAHDIRIARAIERLLSDRRQGLAMSNRPSPLFFISFGVGLLNVAMIGALVYRIVEAGTTPTLAFALFVNVIGGGLCLFNAYRYWNKSC